MFTKPQSTRSGSGTSVSVAAHPRSAIAASKARRHKPKAMLDQFFLPQRVNIGFCELGLPMDA